MTIRIGGIDFDDYEGDIPYQRKRALTYARTDKAGTGVQVLPKSSEPFQFKTWRYEAVAKVETFMASLDALIGTDVEIITELITYSSGFNTKYTVEDVKHLQESQLIRVYGERNAAIVNHSPAALIRSVWYLRGGPHS